MGTNYYAIPRITNDKKESICEFVQEDNFEMAKALMPDKIHIGKKSCGWRFIFNHHDWYYYKPSLSDLKLFLSKCIIIDEYGDKITNDEFWKLVEFSQNEKSELKHGTLFFGLNFSGADFS